MRTWTIVGLALAAASPAGAQDASTPPLPRSPSAQGDVAVTIYNSDLALIQDTRQLDLANGRVRQDFPDVSAAIRPETVTLAVPDATVVEQNFDYDLLSPASLMEKAVGETITIVRTNPGSGAETRERATVLAVNGGVVLRVGDHVEVLRDDGLPARVIFDRVPETLRARPTLSVTLASTRAGRRPATLSYLSNKMGWTADYVALFDQAKGTIDVQGWVTLKNETGTSFADARTLLVAGDPAAAGDNGGNGGYPYRPRRPGPLRAAGTQTAAREQLGDFYLYPLPGRTTIADQQTKQVSFLDVKGASATAGYEYQNDWLNKADEPESASSVLRFSNGKGGGLGDALPAGTVRVYQRDARGQAQFTGESRIGHTPQGSSVALRTGDAFDIKVKPTVVERTRLDPDHWRTRMSYLLTNARARAVTVDLAQAGLDWWWDDTRISAESQKSERRDADSTVWHVVVPANGTVTVTATFDTRY